MEQEQEIETDTAENVMLFGITGMLLLGKVIAVLVMAMFVLSLAAAI